MPGLPGCVHCPYRDDPETPCAVLATKHTRFCEAIDPDNPTHRPGMRRGLVRLTLELLGRPVPPEPRVSFPPIAEQVANLAGAAGRFVASGGELSTPGERERRLAICHDCEQFADGRCRLCGCRLAVKIAMKSEGCPDDPPRW